MDQSFDWVGDLVGYKLWLGWIFSGIYIWLGNRFSWAGWAELVIWLGWRFAFAGDLAGLEIWLAWVGLEIRLDWAGLSWRFSWVWRFGWVGELVGFLIWLSVLDWVDLS